MHVGLVGAIAGLAVDGRAVSNPKNCLGMETSKPLANGLVVDDLTSCPEDCEKTLEVSWVSLSFSHTLFPNIFVSVVSCFLSPVLSCSSSLPPFNIVYSLLAFFWDQSLWVLRSAVHFSY
jgi:hypothetical protein